MIARCVNAFAVFAAQTTTFALACALLAMALSAVWMFAEGVYHLISHVFGG